MKSNKLGSQAFKLATLFRLYFTSIDEAVAKHTLSTDIVPWKQLLRKTVFVLPVFLKSRLWRSAEYIKNKTAREDRCLIIDQSILFDLSTTKETKKEHLFSLRGWPLAICMIGIGTFLLFSNLVHAQTPRKDSGADGPTSIRVGDKVPEEFWDKEHLFYNNGDTTRRSLAEYRGKLLVLDFWFTGCTRCLLHQREIEYYKQKYKGKLAVIMVNSKNTKDNYAKIENLTKQEYYKKIGIDTLISIIDDEYLFQLFQPNGWPAYCWINSDDLYQLRTFRNLLDRNYTAPFIDIIR